VSCALQRVGRAVRVRGAGVIRAPFFSFFFRLVDSPRFLLLHAEEECFPAGLSVQICGAAARRETSMSLFAAVNTMMGARVHAPALSPSPPPAAASSSSSRGVVSVRVVKSNCRSLSTNNRSAKLRLGSGACVYNTFRVVVTNLQAPRHARWLSSRRAAREASGLERMRGGCRRCVQLTAKCDS
jgi:hypothetical protein